MTPDTQGGAEGGRGGREVGDAAGVCWLSVKKRRNRLLLIYQNQIKIKIDFRIVGFRILLLQNKGSTLYHVLLVKCFDLGSNWQSEFQKFLTSHKFTTLLSSFAARNSLRSFVFYYLSSLWLFHFL